MISRTTEYALRALVFLAQHADDLPIPAPRIARATGIPAKYLSAIMATLVRHRLLESSPGKSGGFCLTRRPSEVQLLEVVVPFEPSLAPAAQSPCPFGNPVCSDTDPCAGHEGWKKVKETYVDFLRRTTIEQVAVKKRTKGVASARRRRRR